MTLERWGSIKSKGKHERASLSPQIRLQEASTVGLRVSAQCLPLSGEGRGGSSGGKGHGPILSLCLLYFLPKLLLHGGPPSSVLTLGSTY